MEEVIVEPSKPIFFKHSVYDTYIRGKKKKSDEFYKVLTWDHKYKINHRIESNQIPRCRERQISDKFITQLYKEHGTMHCISKISVTYKRNGNRPFS